MNISQLQTVHSLGQLYLPLTGVQISGSVLCLRLSPEGIYIFSTGEAYTFITDPITNLLSPLLVNAQACWLTHSSFLANGNL